MDMGTSNNSTPNFPGYQYRIDFPSSLTCACCQQSGIKKIIVHRKNFLCERCHHLVSQFEGDHGAVYDVALYFDRLAGFKPWA